MKITIDELFSDIEFENLIKDNWKQQYQKYKKLPAVTKKAVVNELLKHYETVEYIKGSRSHKPCFEIGGRRDVELTQADMVEKGYYKAGSNNINNHNIIALKIFRSYISRLYHNGLYNIEMTSIDLLKTSGIMDGINNISSIYVSPIKNSFKTYYKEDLMESLKNILIFCLNNIGVDIEDASIYYCNLVDGGRRLMTKQEVSDMKYYIKKLNKKYNGSQINFSYGMQRDLKEWYFNKLNSESVVSGFNINIKDLKTELNILSESELNDLKGEFIYEYKKYRDKKHIYREFKYSIKGVSGWQWRLDSPSSLNKTINTPYKQMADRDYFNFMAELDLMMGFGRADFNQYNLMEQEYILETSKLENMIKFINKPSVKKVILNGK